MKGVLMYLHNENIPWNELTTSLKKKELYSSDFYFEISYKTAVDNIRNDICSKINKYTLLFIKPEALLLKKIDVLIDDLQKHHFELVYASIRPINHVQISELWKYAWSAATIIRIIVNQVYYSKFEGGILILRNTQCAPEGASSFLSQIKGTSPYNDPHIRYHMNALNIFLNHIHSPDENADFMRELAIFFAWDELNEIYRRMQSNVTISFQKLWDLTNSYSNCAEIITPEKALDNLIHHVFKETQKSHETERKIVLSEIHSELISIRNNKNRFTHDLIEKMVNADVLNWDWPLFIAITYYMEYSTEYDALI